MYCKYADHKPNNRQGTDVAGAIIHVAIYVCIHLYHIRVDVGCITIVCKDGVATTVCGGGGGRGLVLLGVACGVRVTYRRGCGRRWNCNVCRGVAYRKAYNIEE